MTGKSWEDNIRQNFFVPLGMARSDVSIPELEKSDDIATGYDLKNDSIIRKLEYYHINAMAPAGAINSSVTDMAKWLTVWINNGKYQGKQILPASYRDDAISSQSVIGGSLPGKEKPGIYFSNYGFGWFLASYNGHYRVEHGGDIDGFTASTCFFPADSVGIVVLCNQNNSAFPPVVRNLIADRLLNLKYHDWNSDLYNTTKKARDEDAKIEKEKKTSTNHSPATHKLADYTGNFGNPGYGVMKLYVKHDSLFVKLVTHTLWLRHNNYDIFDVFVKDPKYGIDTSEMQGLKFQFQMNLMGDIDAVSSKFEDGLKPLVFTRQIEIKALTANELQKYTGDYLLGGVTVKIYIKDSKTLYAAVPGQPDYELVPMDNQKFSVKVLDGYFLQFGPPGAAKITEATFIQPNGSFKASRK